MRELNVHQDRNDDDEFYLCWINPDKNMHYMARIPDLITISRCEWWRWSSIVLPES